MYKNENRSGLISGIKYAAGLAALVGALWTGSAKAADKPSYEKILDDYQARKAVVGEAGEATVGEAPESYTTQVLGEVKVSPGVGSTIKVVADDEKYGRGEIKHTMEDDAIGGRDYTNILAIGNMVYQKDGKDIIVRPRGKLTFGDITAWGIGAGYLDRKNDFEAMIELNGMSYDSEDESNPTETQTVGSPIGPITATAATNNTIESETYSQEFILRARKGLDKGNVKGVYGLINLMNSETDVKGTSTSTVTLDMPPGFADVTTTTTQSFEELVEVSATLLQGGVEYEMGPWTHDSSLTLIFTDANGAEDTEAVLQHYAFREFDNQSLQNIVAGARMYIGDNFGVGVDVQGTYVLDNGIVLTPGVMLEKREDQKTSARLALKAIIPPQGRADAIADLAGDYQKTVAQINSMAISDERKSEALDHAKRDFDRNLETIANTGHTELSFSYRRAGNEDWDMRAKGKYQATENWAPIVRLGYGEEGDESEYEIMGGAEWKNLEGDKRVMGLVGYGKENGEDGFKAEVRGTLKLQRY